MKGDFSRIRFNPAKQYTAVLEQQGRVSLDADANEQQAIDGLLRQTTNVDVIGPFGGPENDAGFAVEIVAGRIRIGRGRYYVDGLLVENDRHCFYDEQPYLLDAPDTGADLLEAVLQGDGDVTAQFYLEVWQRLVTQLDDPCLREPALSGADTTARLQTVWRVLGELTSGQGQQGGQTIYGSSGGNDLPSCCRQMYEKKHFDAIGLLSADTSTSGSDCGCTPVPSAGYRGLENQLYRVEIHTPGTLDTATFKWSRENASVVTAITAINGAVATVSGIGPDANLGFQIGQWVELTDDTYLFGVPANQPGMLYLISDIQPAAGQFQVTLSTQITGLDAARNARMRRWDQSGSAATSTGVALSTTAVALENGIEVTFRGGPFSAGDYWTIPARTATGEIDWPPCGGNGSIFQPAQQTLIYRAPLACVHPRTYNEFKADKATYQANKAAYEYDNSRFLVEDCRRFFPPLTALSSDAVPAALHVQSISWVNDDVMSVDALIQNGLSITLDQAPTCPWGGGNFRVTIEAPLAVDALTQSFGNVPGAAGGLPVKDPTDLFLRTVYVLDPPAGITVSGNQVNWLLPPNPSGAQGTQSYAPYLLYGLLNGLLIRANYTGYARVRVKLHGGAVYAENDNGNLYLDGQSFGTTGARAGDGSECIQFTTPSGNSARSSDYEGWFYLSPTVLISNVVIQGVENGTVRPVKAVKVLIDENNNVIGLQIGESATVTSLQAAITLNYAPMTETVVSLAFSGAGAGSVVQIAASVTIPAGQSTITTPISIPVNPGAVTDDLTLLASVPTALGNAPFSPAPPLTVRGSTPQQPTQ